MNILTETCTYQSKAEFEALITALQDALDEGILAPYDDGNWRKPLPNDWNREYIAAAQRKIYRFDGHHFTTERGEPSYNGAWEIVRQETEIRGKAIFTSAFRIRMQEPPAVVDLQFEVGFIPGERTTIKIDWAPDEHDNGAGHSRLVQSAAEYGIISAFEDLAPSHGNYSIGIAKLRYHAIDTSFSLIAYAANRNLKRALFAGHEDPYPMIENGRITRKFKFAQTIGRYNNA